MFSLTALLVTAPISPEADCHWRLALIRPLFDVIPSPRTVLAVSVVFVGRAMTSLVGLKRARATTSRLKPNMGRKINKKANWCFESIVQEEEEEDGARVR